MAQWNHRTDTAASAVQSYLDQTHQDFLIYCVDDRPPDHQFTEVPEDKMRLIQTDQRMNSLPAKYNMALTMAEVAGLDYDAVAILDTDDYYLRRHLERAARAYIEDPSVMWTYPDVTLSTYGGQINAEATAGRFWASTTYRREFLIDAMDGFRDTVACGHDQMHLDRANKIIPPGRIHDPTYCYMWGQPGLGDNHCSAISKGVTDETWYERTPPSFSGCPLVPGYNEAFREVMQMIWDKYPQYMN